MQNAIIQKLATSMGKSKVDSEGFVAKHGSIPNIGMFKVAQLAMPYHGASRIIAIVSILARLALDCWRSQHSKAGQYHRYYIFLSTLSCVLSIVVHQHLPANFHLGSSHASSCGTRCSNPKHPSSELLAVATFVASCACVCTRVCITTMSKCSQNFLCVIRITLK